MVPAAAAIPVPIAYIKGGAVKKPSAINWRANLVPAAAAIPAPIASIKVVAAKKLVVGFLDERSGPLYECVSTSARLSALHTCLRLTAWRGGRAFYFEEIRVFTAGNRLEYISME